jgi:hypothetical protein
MAGSRTGGTDAIRLEASTICQLACPLCPTPSGEIKAKLGSGFLEFDRFRRLVDENPGIWRVELSNWGELFLNPDIERIIEYAYRRSVALTAWNGANLNHVRDAVLEGLARYRFRGITCSIDGVTQETYAAYRRKGDLGRVLEHIRRLNAYKKRWRTEYPHLRWQMIRFDHNAHEVNAARALAAELGMTFHLKANWEEPQAVQPADATGAPTPDIPKTPSATATPRGEDRSLHYCDQLWDEPQINFDGRLLGCCVNTSGTFGPNVFDVGLERALADEKLEYAKRMLLGTVPARADVPCTACDIYVRRAHAGRWVQRPAPHGIAPVFRRHGLGRVVVWIANRFERPLLPALRAMRLATPAPRAG